MINKMFEKIAVFVNIFYWMEAANLESTNLMNYDLVTSHQGLVLIFFKRFKLQIYLLMTMLEILKK